MKGLYKNELLKLISQTSFKVILIIALVISMLVPMANLAFGSLSTSAFVDEEDPDYYDQWISEVSDPVEKAYYVAEKDARSWFKQANIPQSDWRFQIYFDDYQFLVSLKEGFRLIVEEGFSYERVCVMFPLERGFTSAFSITPFTIPGRYSDKDPLLPETSLYPDDGEASTDPDGNDTWQIPTLSQCRDYYTLLQGELAAMQEQLRTMSVNVYFNRCADENAARLAEVKARLSILDAQLQESPGAMEKAKLQNQREAAALECERLEKTEKIYRRAVDENWEYTDWHIAAGDGLRQSIYSTLEGLLADEDMSDANTDAEKRQAQDALTLLEYSLDKDLPIDVQSNFFYSDTTDDRLGGKSAMRSSLDTTVSMMTLFLIVAAGMSVAREHSDGTIRLLLIRPKTRTKILLSKYLALLTYGGGLLAASFLVQGVLFTLQSPMEMLRGTAVLLFGRPVTVPTLLLLLWEALLLSSMAWLLMTISFLFSVLTRRSALAILLPMLCYILNGAVATVSRTLYLFLSEEHPIFGILRYTILPYLEVSDFLSSPLDRFATMGGNIFQNVSTMLTTGFLFPLGLAQILFFAALFTFLAFYAFRRQQIKS